MICISFGQVVCWFCFWLDDSSISTNEFFWRRENASAILFIKIKIQPLTFSLIHQSWADVPRLFPEHLLVSLICYCGWLKHFFFKIKENTLRFIFNSVQMRSVLDLCPKYIASKRGTHSWEKEIWDLGPLYLIVL